MSDTNGNGNTNGSNGHHTGRFVKGDPRIWKGGRGKSNKAIPSLLKKLTNEIKDPNDVDAKTRLYFVCEKLIAKAEAGESWAIQLLFDRMEGRPRQTIEMTNDDAEIGAMNDEQLEAYMAEQSRN